MDESRGTELDSTPGPVAEARTARRGTGQKDPVRECTAPASLFSLFGPKSELSKVIISHQKITNRNKGTPIRRWPIALVLP